MIEVEMKAKITKDIANQIITNRVQGFKINRGGGWTPLYKKDTYYSLHGTMPKEIKDIIRIRRKVTVDSIDCNIFDAILNGKLRSLSPVAGTAETLLTTKCKNVDEFGIERNEELEGPMFDTTVEAFENAMKIANFAPYFVKEKTAASFYVLEESTKYEMHCEIVNVNGVGPYLEIECFADDKLYCMHEGCFASVEKAKELIQRYFRAINITEFETKNWIELTKSR